MKKIILTLLLFVMLLSCASAEESAREFLQSLDLSGFEAFANERNVHFSPESLLDRLADGGIPDWQTLKQTALEILSEPISAFRKDWSAMIVPALVLALMGVALPGKSTPAAFICRIALASGGVRLLASVLQAAGACLDTTSAFSDAAAPILTAVLTASGMTGSAALISPAAALAGNLIQQIFSNWGLALCACTGCIALAANLSETLDLGRVVKFLKKFFGWCSGLALALFTALIFLRGNVTAASDNLALRTAKYAVDSVSPVIGSGVSDAWETYLAGLGIARSSIGISGVILLLSVCVKPMLSMAAAMIIMSLFCIILEICGEKQASRSFEQLSGACQMALTLCGGAMAIWVILMGSMLSLGRWFA